MSLWGIQSGSLKQANILSVGGIRYLRNQQNCEYLGPSPCRDRQGDKMALRKRRGGTGSCRGLETQPSVQIPLLSLASAQHEQGGTLSFFVCLNADGTNRFQILPSSTQLLPIALAITRLSDTQDKTF